MSGATKWIVRGTNGPALAPGHSPRGFADACRTTGLAFLEGAANGWGKRELAAWLLGPYGAVSHRAAATLRLALDAEDDGSAEAVTLRPGVVEELVTLVRVAVCATLSELQGADTAAVMRAVLDGRVVSCDVAGVERAIWAPVDRPGMRLEDRVSSLFVADWLLRPRSYERDLSICGACDRVVFAPAPRCACELDSCEAVLELSQRWLLPARAG